MHIPKQCFHSIEWNWKTGLLAGAVSTLSVLLITAVTLGILGVLNVVPALNGIGFYFTVTAPGILVLNGLCFFILMITSKKSSTQSLSLVISYEKFKKKEKYSIDSEPSTHDAHFESFISERCKAPLKAEEYDFECEKGSGFPLVNQDIRQEVITNTQLKLTSIMSSPEKQKELAPYLKHVKYIKHSPDDSKLFFPEGDILQTPVLLQYDEKFILRESENYFYMHSSPAPKPTHYSDKTGYLNTIERAYFHLLQGQVCSGAKHILTNYWGMGAFIRGYYKDPKQMYVFRLEIAQRLSYAFRKVVDDYSEKKFTFYIGGPTGISFVKELQAEPRDNFNAMVLMFSQLGKEYRNRIIFCPETDIFVKGQEISDSYKCNPGELAPVSATNASDPHQFGNRWFDGKLPSKKGFNAQFAIEENTFRRAVILAFIASKVNLSSECYQGVDSLHILLNNLSEESI